jgi:hypothetical protein
MQLLADLFERQCRLDLGAQLACFDQPAERRQYPPVDVGVEGLARDAPPELRGRNGGDC